MLETLRNSIHSKCQQCSRNHECEAEKNLRDEKKEKLQDTLNQCENYKSHKRIANHQADAFSKAMQELKESECLVVEDFAGRFIVKQDIKLSQRDFFARKGIPDLVLFCYYITRKEIRLKNISLIFLQRRKRKRISSISVLLGFIC